MKLYIAPLNMFGMKVRIAAIEKGLNPEIIWVPYSDETGYNPKHPDVTAINPKNQVPVLIHDDLKLFDSTQIFEYFEDLQPTPNLWPKSITARAQARLLELQADEVYFPEVVKLMFLQDDLTQAAAMDAIKACEDYYDTMETMLNNKDYFMVEFTFVDIAFFMTQLFGERMGAKLKPKTPNLIAWRHRMIQRESVQTTFKPMVEFLRKGNRPVPDFLEFL